MRVLLVEDDLKIAGFVKKGLTEAGFAVDHVDEGITGLHMALGEPYDAAIFDIMLPGIDGLEIIEKMRGAGIKTPVIILSAKRSVEDRIRGIQTGADDYLIKPFSFSELLVRVQALIRRSGDSAEPVTLKAGDLTLNLLSREVQRDEKVLDLQPKEFSLLELLMKNAGNVISKTAIMESLWDYNFDPQTNVVDVLVCRLRNKLDKGFEFKMIQTLRGVGYVLKTPK